MPLSSTVYGGLQSGAAAAPGRGCARGRAGTAVDEGGVAGARSIEAVAVTATGGALGAGAAVSIGPVAIASGAAFAASRPGTREKPHAAIAPPSSAAPRNTAVRPVARATAGVVVPGNDPGSGGRLRATIADDPGVAVSPGAELS